MGEETRLRKPKPTACRHGEEILNDLMGRGIVKHDQKTHEYLGCASDGKWVGIGTDLSYRVLLRFLEDRPTPDRW